MEIIPYNDSFFEKLIIFLRKNWADEHAIYDKPLFDWQYKGPMNDTPCAFLVTENDRVCGFLGGVPYDFLLNGNRISGVGFAIWIMDKALKNSGIGLMLRKNFEKLYDVTYSIGINLNAAGLYSGMNYSYYNSLRRYVIALNAEKYMLFLLRGADYNLICNWVNKQNKSSSIDPADTIDPFSLETLYMSNIAPNFKLLPYKNKNFWQWRYIENYGFRYVFFKNMGCVIIARVENVYAPQNKNLHNLKCLRIVEILPSSRYFQNDGDDALLFYTLTEALNWARKTGCVLADFYISNSYYDKILLRTGFIMQETEPVADIVRLFSPYRQNVNPLNYAYRINNREKSVIRDEDTYFLKSDGDMDRPNFLK